MLANRQTTSRCDHPPLSLSLVLPCSLRSMFLFSSNETYAYGLREETGYAAIHSTIQSPNFEKTDRKRPKMTTGTCEL